MMSSRLGKESWESVGRFAVKVCISVILGSFGEVGRSIGTSGWLALYAVFSGIIALGKGERFPSRGFNHWDEALWLVAASSGLHVLTKMFA